MTLIISVLLAGQGVVFGFLCFFVTVFITYLLTYLLELPVVTDDEFVGVALTARHLHYDTRMGANASTRVTAAAASHVCLVIAA